MQDMTDLKPQHDRDALEVREVPVSDLWLFAPFLADLAGMLEEECAEA